MKSILIVGGSGYIGSNLAIRLTELGFYVTILDKKKKETIRALENRKNLNFYFGDLGNNDFLENIFNSYNFDCIFHLYSSLIPNSPLHDINIKSQFDLNLTSNLLDLMIKKNINKIVYFSSGGAIYRTSNELMSEETIVDPVSIYGITKISIESLIRQYSDDYKIKHLILRPSNPYGKNQNPYGSQGIIAVLLGSLLMNTTVAIRGNGASIRDYIYIDDLINITIKLLENTKWNETYNVGTGVGTSINELILLINKVTGRILKVNYTDRKDTDLSRNVLNITKLTSQLGEYEFKSLHESIKSTWEYLNNAQVK